MDELNRKDETEVNELASVASLDAQLAELIGFVWAREAAARLDDRIDAAIKYGRN